MFWIGFFIGFIAGQSAIALAIGIFKFTKDENAHPHTTRCPQR